MTPPYFSESGAPPESNLDLLHLCCALAAHRFHTPSFDLRRHVGWCAGFAHQLLS